MAANSSLLGSWRHLLLVWAARGDLRQSSLGDMCLTPYCPQSRLHTAQRGAFGNLQGAAVSQAMESICTNMQNKGHVAEAQRRAKFKFPGRRQICNRKKCSCAKREAHAPGDLAAEERRLQPGCGVTHSPTLRPSGRGRARTHGSLRATPPHSHPPIILLSVKKKKKDTRASVKEE